MTRLIDADELTAQIMSMAIDKCIVYGNDAMKRSKEIFALAMVAQAPTVEAVPVIRCKDCYFYGTFQRKHYCTKYEHSVKQDGFCAWAEPKEKP